MNTSKSVAELLALSCGAHVKFHPCYAELASSGRLGRLFSGVGLKQETPNVIDIWLSAGESRHAVFSGLAYKQTGVSVFVADADSHAESLAVYHDGTFVFSEDVDMVSDIVRDGITHGCDWGGGVTGSILHIVRIQLRDGKYDQGMIKSDRCSDAAIIRQRVAADRNVAPEMVSVSSTNGQCNSGFKLVPTAWSKPYWIWLNDTATSLPGIDVIRLFRLGLVSHVFESEMWVPIAESTLIRN